MENIRSKLGEILKASRKAKQVTLRQLEEMSGVSNPYLSQLENGKIINPSAVVLYKLAGILSIDFDNLMVAAGFVDPQPHQLPQPTDLLAMAVTPKEEQELIRYLNYLRYIPYHPA